MFEQDLDLEEMEGLAEGQVAKQRRTEEGHQGPPVQNVPVPTSQPVPVPPVQPPLPTDPMMASLSALLDAKVCFTDGGVRCYDCVQGGTYPETPLDS